MSARTWAGITLILAALALAAVAAVRGFAGASTGFDGSSFLALVCALLGGALAYSGERA